MKKLVTLFVALFVVAGLVSAQTADTTFRHGFGGKKMAMHRFQRNNAGHRLNLTDAQKAQMKTINDDYRKQLSALQGNDKISLGDYKQQLAALQKSHRKQVKNIFTDDQKKEMADNRQNVRKRMHERGAANLEKMKKNLDLTDAQVTTIKTQREQLRTQLQALHSDSTLLREQKREKMKEIFAQQKEQLKTVLTPEQLTKLQNMQKERMNRFHRADGDKSQAK